MIKKIMAVVFCIPCMIVMYEKPDNLSQLYICSGNVRCKKGTEYTYCSYSNWSVPSATSPGAATNKVFEDCAGVRGADVKTCEPYGAEPLTCSGQVSSI